MIDTLSPGQKIKCTVNAWPRAKAKGDTIARLMRRDPEISKGLKRAQAHRKRTMKIYTRGGRDWYSRVRSGKNLRVIPGETWTMTYVHQIAPDLRSVESLLTIEPA